MTITLVNADFPSESPVPPLGVLSLAQAAENDGHDVIVRDYQLASPVASRDSSVFARFCETTSQVLGVSVSGFALPLVVLALKKVKQKRPGLITILGGIGASGASREILTEFPWIDIVVRGEGEQTLRQLLLFIKENRALSDVAGIAYRENGCVRENERRPRMTDLRCLGKQYFRHIDLTEYKLVNIMSSRGCPFSCTFCDVAPYWHREYVARPIDQVASEISHVCRVTNPLPTFIFVDDTLTVDRCRVVQLCQMLGPRGLNVEWACYARASDLDTQILELMVESGCRKIYIGLESGSDRILAVIRKGFSAETGRRAALLAKRFVSIVQASFVWGFPFETWEDFYATLMLMGYLTSKGVCVKANVLTPLPFSTLFRKLSGSMIFLPEYSPQLRLAEYESDEEIVELIRRYPRIFPCFYFYDAPALTAKYDLLRRMKLSPEHIWDIWAAVKGPVPTRQNPSVDAVNTGVASISKNVTFTPARKA